MGKSAGTVCKTELDVKRDTPLAEGGAISQKELDDSIQAIRCESLSGFREGGRRAGGLS